MVIKMSITIVILMAVFSIGQEINEQFPYILKNPIPNGHQIKQPDLFDEDLLFFSVGKNDTCRPKFVETEKYRYSYIYNTNNKLSELITEMLTGGAFRNYNRQNYTYDNEGRIIEILLQVWTNEMWSDASKRQYIYDNYGNLLSKTRYSWQGNWTNINRYTYSYDANNYLTADLYETGCADLWCNVEKNTYSFDSLGNHLLTINEQWLSGQWYYMSKYIFSYDSSGNILAELDQVWAGTNWVNSFKFDYNYENELLTTYIKQSWSGNTWNNMFRWTYTYNSINLTENILMEDWLGGGWVNDIRISYTYDANNLFLTTTWEYWEPVWTQRYKLSLSYDNNRNVITEIFESWDFVIATHKRVFSFDSRNNCTRGESYYFHNNTWDPGQGDFTIYYNGKKDSIEFHSTIWVDVIYDPAVNSADEQKEFKYALQNNYPNPFNSSTRISYSIPVFTKVIIKVFDIIGNELETLISEEKPSGDYELTWNASDLPSGVYFYQFKGGDFIQTRKMILLK